MIIVPLTSANPCASRPRASVSILAGQSNAAGRAQQSELSAANASFANPYSSILYAHQELVQSTSAIQFDQPIGDLIPKDNGNTVFGDFGIELSLGRCLDESYVKECPQDTVVLLKFAVGSSSMAQWIPGGKFHDQFIAWLTSQISIINQTYDIVPDRFFWAQGEADALAETPPSTYTSMFGQMMNVVNGSVPGSFDTVYIETKSNRGFEPEDSNAAAINTAMQSITSYNVDTSSATLRDFYHYDADSMIDIGSSAC